MKEQQTEQAVCALICQRDGMAYSYRDGGK